MFVNKMLCLAAVVLAAATLTDATPRGLQQWYDPTNPAYADAADNGSPYDAVWMCVAYFSGTPKYGIPGGDCGSAQNNFTKLLTSFIPKKSIRPVSIQMMAVPQGCCIQADIYNTSQVSLATNKAFDFMINKKTGLPSSLGKSRVSAWAKSLGICGPSTAIDFLVGWDIYQPVAAKYFGCNVGSGVKLPPGAIPLKSLCHC